MRRSGAASRTPEAVTTGRADYGIDTRLECMLHAVVARPPVYGGSVRSQISEHTDFLRTLAREQKCYIIH